MSRLYIMCGLPFAGKTTLARDIARTVGATVVALDEINSQRGVGGDGTPITPDEWDESYAESYRRTAAHLRAGSSVVYDATNFTRDQRDRLRDLARSAGAVAGVVYLEISEEEARRRWAENRATGDRFDVRDEDFELVVASFQPPTDNEHVQRVGFETPRSAFLDELRETHPRADG